MSKTWELIKAEHADVVLSTFQTDKTARTDCFVDSNCSAHCLRHQKTEQIHRDVGGRGSEECGVISLVAKCHSFIMG